MHRATPCDCTERNINALKGQNKIYMSQSLAKVYVHIVFSTKHREKLIVKEVRNELYSYIGGILKNVSSPLISIGGTSDHIHILCLQSKLITSAKLVEEIKRSSSKWIKSQHEKVKNFRWQNGYGIFSISRGHVETVINYINNQEEHHRKDDFKAEFRELLKIYEVEYDERYVWD